jgi:NADH dehydrogenase [ubiquinone] 1 alpha subcomplex assembly factor 7
VSATSSEGAAAPTPLEERLAQLIRDNGPISVGDYMSDALCHPQHGYYATRDPFGATRPGQPGGDFTTAPEISQVFGEVVGAWLIHAWTEIGEPSAFNLVELGPGRGTLMADVLRVGRVRPGFAKAASLYMVEASGRMRYAQQRTLRAAEPEVAARAVWADRLDDVPAGPTLILANEFLDCLPIRQFVRTAERGEAPWRERLVGLDGDRLVFVLSEERHPDPAGVPRGAQPEAVFEVSGAAQEVAGQIAARLVTDKGRALLIDYGHGRSGFGDTFQAVRAHAQWPVLSAPGEADVTVHVDFGALSRRARADGARVDGPVRQGDFLRRLGVEARAAKLAEKAGDEASAKDILTGAERLIAPGQMGELFKVMAISSPSLGEPAGFS